jgi:hypothetical protein
MIADDPSKWGRPAKGALADRLRGLLDVLRFQPGVERGMTTLHPDFVEELCFAMEAAARVLEASAPPAPKPADPVAQIFYMRARSGWIDRNKRLAEFDAKLDAEND